MSEPLLRPAGPHDVAAMLAIYAPLVSDSIITFEEEVPSADEFMRRVDASHRWLVADIDGETVGYAYADSLQERASYRWSIAISVYVHPDFHRRGVGRALLQRVLAETTEMGFVNAFAGVALPNPGSVALFESFGFQRIALQEQVGFK